MTANINRFSVHLLSNQMRIGFDCNDANLNRYFAFQAGQDQQRGIATCYVAKENETTWTAGYYTLSACHIYLHTLPQEYSRKLPRYTEVPAARIGRLAVDIKFQGTGLGRALIGDAVLRISRSEMAVTVVVVDAKDEEVSAFYQRLGFMPIPDQPLSLFAPLKLLRKAAHSGR